MKYANVLMSSQDAHNQRLGGQITRSDRNAWAETLEPTIRSMSPFPITYDVCSTQPANFSEYTYTEFAGGVYVSTQSIDINARIMAEAVTWEGDIGDLGERWESIIQDKYKLEESDQAFPERVIFMPANNCLELISYETLSRVTHEDDEVRVKPHPLIDQEANKTIASKVGWNKMISPKASGMQYLKNAKEIYAASCSELALLGALLGKKVHNIGVFFHEAEGAYYPMTRAMFLEKDQRDAVLRMAACDYSGLIFPWHTEAEVKDRLEKFFAKSLELREIYSPLHVRFPRKIPGPQK